MGYLISTETMPATKAIKKTAVKATKAKAPKAKVSKAGKPMTKSAVLASVVEKSSVSKTDVKAVLLALEEVAAEELKKHAVFTLHHFAKFIVKKKAATKARMGINPFTKEPCQFKAKPASKTVRARALKGIKSVV